MSKLEISEVHEKKVIMWSVIQLMTHFTGNNFFGAITNTPADVPEALLQLLAPNHDYGSSLSRR